VEDDESIQDVLKIILRRAGYEPIVYTTGRAIMERDFASPDVFLIDKQLPGIDGLTICRKLKEDPETKGVPVIMMSAYPNVEELSALAGADAFIEKPFKIDHLLLTITKYVSRAVTQTAIVSTLSE
jgi:DNA-binding response OmpR family regulator